MRYFWPRDRQLSSRIPVMAKNCMKLCFLFIAFATRPRGLRPPLGFWTPPGADGGAEDAMSVLGLTNCLGLCYALKI